MNPESLSPSPSSVPSDQGSGEAFQTLLGQQALDPDYGIRSKFNACMFKEQCCALLDAAVPSSPLSSGDGWQPIETAPRDTRVLLYSPASGDFFPSQVEARVYHDSRAGSRHAWATHWMPLPAAPSRSGKPDT